MAPEVEARITQALDSGQLTLMATKVASIEPTNTGARVTYRPGGDANSLDLQVGAVVDCTGIVKDRNRYELPRLR